MIRSPQGNSYEIPWFLEEWILESRWPDFTPRLYMYILRQRVRYRMVYDAVREIAMRKTEREIKKMYIAYYSPFFLPWMKKDAYKVSPLSLSLSRLHRLRTIPQIRVYEYTNILFWKKKKSTNIYNIFPYPGCTSIFEAKRVQSETSPFRFA